MAVVANDNLRERFAEYQSSVQAELAHEVRRRRATELRDLLADPEDLTLDLFNREVWSFDSAFFSEVSAFVRPTS